MKGFTLRMIFVSGLRITQGKRGWNDLLEHLEKLFKVSPFSSDVYLPGFPEYTFLRCQFLHHLFISFKIKLENSKFYLAPDKY